MSAHNKIHPLSYHVWLLQKSYLQHFVLWFLEYASTIWSPYSKQNIGLLESLLHHGACWACKLLWPLTLSMNSIFCELLWKPLLATPLYSHDVTSLVIAHDIIYNYKILYIHVFLSILCQLAIATRSHSQHQPLQYHASIIH